MLEPIEKIAKKVNISEAFLKKYEKYKAKVDLSLFEKLKDKEDGKLILVTAITPTKAGEGKTTASISLVNGLKKIGYDSLLCLREPSLGPVFGLKGGATGGGKVTIEPSEDINLHFNGDMHALTSSINLIAAVLDNHIYQGNELNIDPEKIVWKRALDVNDRELREIEIGLGSKVNGIKRTEHFEITVASELMAVFCLASSKEDFKERMSNIIVAYTFDDKPVYVKDLKITNAIMKLMENALNPNLVQTSEHNPCFVHGGPFANIAHGCSSLIATKLALKLSPIVVTEAGFAADLGAEKFLDIKCRVGNIKPSLIVLVATIRALKLHGGVEFEDLDKENIEALKEGFSNLEQHFSNLRKYNLPVLVVINRFKSDTKNEIKVLEELCRARMMKITLCDGFLKGGDGCIDFANKTIEMLETTNNKQFNFLYNLEDTIENKIKIIAKEIYRADDVIFLDEAKKDIELINSLNKSSLPICMAKTQSSFSDNPKLINTPRNFKITVRKLKLSNGAGFIVAYCGNILTMPGLPKIPAAVLMENE